MASVGQSLAGNNVIAGPASAKTMSGPGGGGGAQNGAGPSGTPPAGAGTRPNGAGGGGEVSTQTTAYLEAHQGSAKYLVAATGSQATAPIIIATGKAVVTIGGFNGADAAPTVSQLSAMVAKGELKYVLVSSGGASGRPGGGSNSSLTTWVKQHGKAVSGLGTSGGTLYLVTAS